MIRLSRTLFAAGAAVTFAACSGTEPTTAPDAAPTTAAAGDLVASASTASASCTITPNGAGYDVTVSWSGFSATGIVVRLVNSTQPLAQTVLAHPTRKGSLTYTLTTAPDIAEVTGRQIGLRVPCTMVT